MWMYIADFFEGISNPEILVEAIFTRWVNWIKYGTKELEQQPYRQEFLWFLEQYIRRAINHPEEKLTAFSGIKPTTEVRDMLQHLCEPHDSNEFYYLEKEYVATADQLKMLLDRAEQVLAGWQE